MCEHEYKTGIILWPYEDTDNGLSSRVPEATELRLCDKCIHCGDSKLRPKIITLEAQPMTYRNY